MQAGTGNADLVRGFFDGLNSRELEGVVRVIAPGFLHHGMPTSRGPEGMRAVGEMFLAGFPDMRITLDDVIADGDRVASRGRWTGTHTGEFMGIPATGREVDVPFIDTWRVEDGLLAENWVQMDILGMMQQLGVAPMPAPAAAIA
jgi:steroid delta-isomerase-like uncharacterized protein